jgi:putative ABC transport system permease protein
LHAAYPLDYAGSRLAVVPVEETLVGASRPALLVVFGAVCCLLLIACANVASLLLARAAKRQREIAVRSALGAGRGRLVRQLLTESALLGVLGGGLGVGLAAVGLAAVVRGAAGQLPKIEHAALDLRVLGFALVLVLVSGLAFGLAPALGLARGTASNLARGTRVAGDARSTRARRLLVVANIALAFVLLVGAGLMLESVGRLLSTDPGFEPRGVLSLNLSFVGPRYEEDAAALLAMEDLTARVGALPGVRAAAIASQVPLGDNYDTWGSEVEGREARQAEDEVELQRYGVTPEYFEALRLPLRRGRLLADADRADTEKVMLLGETAAAVMFGNEDPLGRRIRFGGPDMPWRTVVGVVGDVRHEGLSAPFTPQMYVPQAQITDRFVVLVVRTAVPPASLAPALRRVVAETAPGVPISQVATLEELARGTAGRERFTLALLGAFSVIGLLLAAVGLYGLIAFLVESQRQELGVRIALGAMRWDVALRVLRPGVLLLGSGLALGWAAALGLTGLLGKLLYQVTPHDPQTYAGIALLLASISLVAHLAPLARALAVDPTAALRAD